MILSLANSKNVKSDIMKKEVRIIDGVLKVVEIVDNKIVKIVKDYKKPIIDKYKREEYIKSDIEKHKGEREKIECVQKADMKKREIYDKRRKEADACNENMRILEEKEIVHEIHYGKRHKYQTEKTTNGPDKYRKRLLEYKASLGKIDKNIINMKNSKELLNDWAGEGGFRSYENYLNIVAIERGFICYGEYEKVWSYYPEMPSPIKENRTDPRFIGIYIAENGIAGIYEGSKRMPYYNPGYDIICPKGYKIDVKATILNKYNTFSFSISKNKIADYFALVVFNNIIELIPTHMWIIKSDEDIDGRMVKMLHKLVIPNEPKYLDKYRKYEKLDKLSILKNLCEKFDAKNRIEINDDNVTNRYAIINIASQIRSDKSKEVSLIDILDILEKKKKLTKTNGIPIVPIEDVVEH